MRREIHNPIGSDHKDTSTRPPSISDRRDVLPIPTEGHEASELQTPAERFLGGVTRLSTLEEIRTTTEPGQGATSDEQRRQNREEQRRQRHQSLVVSYHKVQPVQVAWTRHETNGPINVIVGGDQLVTATSDKGDAVLTYPIGGRGQHVEGENVYDYLSEEFPHWVPITGEYDPLMGEQKGGGTSFEDTLKSYPDSFAYVIQATPIPPEEINKLRIEVSKEWERLKNKDGLDRELDEERLKAENKMLRVGQSDGLWNIRLLVGARTEEDLQELPGIISGVVDRGDEPYFLKPDTHEPRSLEDIAHDDEGTFFRGPTSLLAALGDLPRGELPGVEVVSRPKYKVNITEAHRIPPERTMELGNILDHNDNPAGPLVIDSDMLTRHEILSGMTGSGKTEASRIQCEKLSENEIYWTVIDPKKSPSRFGDYAVLADRLAESGIDPKHSTVNIIRPGDLSLPAMGLNPFEPDPSVELSEHIPQLLDLLVGAFGAGNDHPEASEMTRRYLQDALWGKAEKGFAGVYERAGWDITTGKSKLPNGKRPPYPTMWDLQAVAYEAVERLGYVGDASNIKTFIEQRIGSLARGTAGQFFDGYPLSIEEILKANTIFKLDKIPPADQSLVMGTLMLRLVQHLSAEQRQQEGKKQHQLVIEEANLIAEEGPVAKRVADMLLTARSSGLGMTLVTQVPHKLSRTVIANTANRFALGLPLAEDQHAMGSAMNLNPDQEAHLARTKVGQVVYMAQGMDGPVLGQIKDPTGRPNRTDLVVSAEPLVETRHGQGIYNWGERHAAQEFLQSMEGKGLTGWIDLAVSAQLMGLGPITPKENSPLFSQMLKTSGQWNEATQRVMDCAIEESSIAAVEGRAHIILQEKSEEEMTSLIQETAQHVHAVIYGEEVSTEHDDELDSKYTLGANNLASVLFAQSKYPGQHVIDQALGMNIDDAMAKDAKDAEQKAAEKAQEVRSSLQKIAQATIADIGTDVLNPNPSEDEERSNLEWMSFITDKTIGELTEVVNQNTGEESLGSECKKWLDQMDRLLANLDMNPFDRQILFDNYKAQIVKASS